MWAQAGKGCGSPKAHRQEEKPAHHQGCSAGKASQLLPGLGWLPVAFAGRDLGSRLALGMGLGNPWHKGVLQRQSPVGSPGRGGHWKSILSQGDDSRSHHLSFFTPEYEAIRNGKAHLDKSWKNLRLRGGCGITQQPKGTCL